MSQAKPSKPRWMGCLLAGCLVAFLLPAGCAVVMVIGASTTDASNAGSTKSTGGAAPSYAVKLASIEAGHVVEPSDPSVAQFQVVLKSLGSKVDASESAISDTIVMAHKLVGQNGLEMSLLAVAKNLDQATPAGQRLSEKTFTETAAAWVTVATTK